MILWHMARSFPEQLIHSSFPVRNRIPPGSVTTRFSCLFVNPWLQIPFSLRTGALKVTIDYWNCCGRSEYRSHRSSQGRPFWQQKPADERWAVVNDYRIIHPCWCLCGCISWDTSVNDLQGAEIITVCHHTRCTLGCSQFRWCLPQILAGGLSAACIRGWTAS